MEISISLAIEIGLLSGIFQEIYPETSGFFGTYDFIWIVNNLTDFWNKHLRLIRNVYDHPMYHNVT